MFDHNHVNGSAESSRIDGVPCLGDRAADAPHVLHASDKAPTEPSNVRKASTLGLFGNSRDETEPLNEERL